MYKSFFSFLACGVMGYSLGFAPMGNVSTSMGGAGVALRNSAWGLYYNPALLSSDPRSKFSFSGGLYLTRTNLNEILELNPQTDYTQVQEILSNLKDSKAGIETQLGVVAQIGGFVKTSVQTQEDEYGRLISVSKEEQSSAFAIGAFASSIVDISISGGSGSNYKASSFGIVLMEIPVGYAYKLGTEFGDFNFGVAMKYLRAVFDHSSYGGNAYNGIEVSMPNFLTMSPSQNFGIDLGFLYSYADFHIGVTAKNINCPTFKGSGEKIQLDPQLRLGMSYEFAEHYVVAMDLDLLPYDSYSVAAPKSQYFGIGIMGDYTKFDFRFGISADMLGKDGAKISAGFNAFGILDIVGEMGTNFAKFKGSKLATPTNFGFKIGSTFTF